MDEHAKTVQIRRIAAYFRAHRGTHAYYAFSFFFCEFLNLVNIMAQIWFIDYFVDGEFTTLGFDVLMYLGMQHQDRPDPMNRVFPKQTKCTFQKFGVSGTVEVTDGLCLLPLNTMNEKIFVFLWFYLMLVSGITLILFMYRFACLFPFTRSRRIYSKVWSFNIHVGNCSLLYNNHLF